MFDLSERCCEKPEVYDLLGELYSRKLVLKGITIRCIKGLPLSIPHGIFEGVEELTLIASSQFLTDWGGNLDKGLNTFADIWRVPRDPDDWQLRQANLVLFEDGPQHQWTMKTVFWSRRSRSTPSYTFENAKLLVFGKLIVKCPKDAILNIVNAGSLGPATVKLKLKRASESSGISSITEDGYPEERSTHTYEAIAAAYKRLVKDRALKEVPAAIGRKRKRRRYGLGDDTAEAEQAAREKVEEAFKRVRWLTMKDHLRQNRLEGGVRLRGSEGMAERRSIQARATTVHL
ncbi:hypothetical protein I316_00480 [Kwoniella heveanensis BCC8398]|uniref:Uncharacterized protein n=1 Tax=Kwoniella heveanensis BCC8398 TaxID=1296120 RepID=A0A1B9H257_9TREE|nr:hypothetical protein I316_00480 [Kwoniella heveanensis BCC8398]